MLGADGDEANVVSTRVHKLYKYCSLKQVDDNSSYTIYYSIRTNDGEKEREGRRKRRGEVTTGEERSETGRVSKGPTAKYTPSNIKTRIP